MDFPGLEAGPLGLATFLGGLLLSCMDNNKELHLASWVLFSPHLGWEGPSLSHLFSWGSSP